MLVGRIFHLNGQPGAFDLVNACWVEIDKGFKTTSTYASANTLQTIVLIFCAFIIFLVVFLYNRIAKLLERRRIPFFVKLFDAVYSFVSNYSRDGGGLDCRCDDERSSE